MIAKKTMKKQEYIKTRQQDVADLCRYIRNAKSHMTSRPTSQEEPEKVLCTGSIGMVFTDPEAQISEMAGLAAKAKSGDPVSHFVLSWPSNEKPTEQQFHEAARIFVHELELDGHQVIYAAHKNTENYHLHLAVNRVNPETLQVTKINNGFDKFACMKSICTIEHVQGWTPEKNAVYQMTKDGPVLVENREKSLSKGAWDAERKTGNPSLERRAKELASEIALATSWQDLHLRLAAHGVTYEKRKGGAVLKFGKSGFVKASSASRDCSLKSLEKKFGAEFERARIAPKPYEPKQPQPRQNLNFAELLLAVIFKIFGFNSAAKQILYSKQALERAELQQQKFHTAQQKWAAQSIMKEEHAQQRAALAAQQEKELSAVKAMSKQELVKYCENKGLFTEEGKNMDRNEIFQSFSEAMGADRYRVTSKLDAPGEGMTPDQINRQHFTFGKREDLAAGKIQQGEAARGFTPTEVQTWMPKIEAWGDKKDRGTYVTPLATDTHYIVVDDIKTEQQIEAVRGLAPAYIGASSRGSYQAVLKVHAHSDPQIARLAANATAAELNQKYGDPAVRNGMQPFRMPGFDNHKPKHLENGQSPTVTMLHAAPVFCEKTQRLYDENVARLQQEMEQKKAQQPVAQVQQPVAQQEQAGAEFAKNGLKYVDIYQIHAVDSLRGLERAGRPAPTGRNLDYMLGIRLRACGYTEQETAKVLENARHFQEMRGGDTPHQGAAVEAARAAELAQHIYNDPDCARQVEKQSGRVSNWLKREKSEGNKLKKQYEQQKMASGNEKTIENEEEYSYGR